MNTETENSAPEAKALPKALGQLGVSSLALICLLIAAILNPELWVQFGVAVVLVLLTFLFTARVQKVSKKPWESIEAQLLIEAAEKQTSRKEKLVSSIAKYWPAFVLVMAVVAVVISPYSIDDISDDLAIFAAVLLLTNVQGLSLTIPLAISNALRAGTGAGLLIRNRQAFEAAAKLDLVLFTKGGLITESPKGVNSVHLSANSSIGDESKLLALAASVEAMSKHVFAKAIAKSARTSGLKLVKAKDFNEYPGLGVEANVAGQQVLVGSIALLIQRNIRMEVQELIYADESTKNGYSIVCVVVDELADR